MSQIAICNIQRETDNETSEKFCTTCKSKMADYNYCVECRSPVFATCTGCGKKDLVELHEFCYCQLELYNT